MKCAKVRELFSSYLENAIEPSIGVAVEQHFAECPRCKAGYERFRATAMLLDELPEMAPPPGFHETVMARVNRVRRTTPQPVRWWNVDWQNVFNARVPVRAVAMGAAILVVLAILIQFTPLSTIVAIPFGGRMGKNLPPGAEVIEPVAPLPWSSTKKAQVQFQRQGAGLTMGLMVNSVSEDQVVYLLKLDTNSGGSIPVEAYLLPRGTGVGPSSGEASKIISGRVSEEAGNVVPVVVSSAGNDSKSVVVHVRWTYNGVTRNEFIFLPPQFNSSAANESVSFSLPAGIWRDSLSTVSEKCGIVIAVPGNIMRKSKALQIESASPGSAVYQVVIGNGVKVRALGSSVYMVEPIR